ncbi:MAG: MlaD family protein, partial [bacterium]
MVVLFMVSFAFILSMLSYWGFLKTQGYDYFVRVPNIKGLVNGSLVRYNGAESGTVEGWTWDNDSRLVDVRIRIDRKIRIPRDSRYFIAVKSVIPPEVYLDIQPGFSKDYLKPGEHAPQIGETEPDLADLVKDLSSQIKILSTSLNGTLSRVNAT